jgi:hypothetical protein
MTIKKEIWRLKNQENTYFSLFGKKNERKTNSLNFNLAGKNSASVPPFLITYPPLRL